jgi:hypothetical protein
VLIYLFSLGISGVIEAGPCPGKCLIDSTSNANGWCSLITVPCTESHTGEVVRMSCSKIKVTYDGDAYPCKGNFSGIIIE